MKQTDLQSADIVNERKWRSFEGYILYRVALAGILVALFFGGIGPVFLGQADGRLFALGSIVYMGVVLSGLLLVRWRRPGLDIQALIATLTDTMILTLLMHASGGITTGLGMLTGIAVVMVSLSISGRGALFAAAFAALTTLGESVYASAVDHVFSTTFTQAGILGTAFFAVAILSSTLSGRARESAKLAQQRSLDLENLEQLNAYVLQHIETGIIVTDEKNRIRMMNESAWYLSGMPANWKDSSLTDASPVLGKALDLWASGNNEVPPPFRPSNAAKEVQPTFTGFGEGSQKGTLIFLDDTAIVSQRAQQMKLASLGRLTASIAHEIRNPLGAISHAGQLLQESSDLPRSDIRLAEIICNNSERVNHIIENILQLSRRTKGRTSHVKLRRYVEDFVLRYCTEHHVDPQMIKIRIEPADVAVYIDISQMDQVLTNLINNAFMHATGDSDVRAAIQLSGGINDQTASPYLDVADNGVGIDEDVAKQIFEPFFSTQTTGSGLGLYLARELCECNRANLSYIPLQQGNGSCFRIVFSGKSGASA